MNDDARKGMIEYARRESDISCPHCNEQMETFNYRANNLPIDHCKNEHGYWLDAGEEKKVLETMKQRVQDCLLYTSPSPRDATLSRMPSSG